MKIQEAKEKDIKAIRKIEKEYYEGYSCPENILRNFKAVARLSRATIRTKKGI